jgi:hypothetical protein
MNRPAFASGRESGIGVPGKHPIMTLFVSTRPGETGSLNGGLPEVGYLTKTGTPGLPRLASGFAPPLSR